MEGESNADLHASGPKGAPLAGLWLPMTGEGESTAALATPMGPLTLAAVGDSLIAIRFSETPGAAETPFLREAVRELEAYFAGRLTEFTIPMRPKGTPFQQEVWTAVSAVPYGTTSTYSEIAASIGRPKAVRAAGAANGANPIPILIPCHRIVGTNGDLTGYAGGLEMKLALLRLEGALLV